MSAYNTTSFLVNFADDPDSNFAQNPEYISKICFCVDAQEWDNVTLYYDMKQTYSMHYLQNWGHDSSEYASSMRMLINGEQFGDQFHPTTNGDDPYLTHIYSLDQLAGSYFEFCFQSKSYVNSGADPIDGSPGDNTFLDNIRFVNEEVLSVNAFDNTAFELYPNPSNGVFYLVSERSIETLIIITDALGKEVLNTEVKLYPNEAYSFDLSHLSKGLYSMHLHGAEGDSFRKILIH